jgi:hypothetical protein
MTKCKKGKNVLTLQMLFDAAGEVRGHFLERNVRVARAVQNLDLYSPEASNLFELIWFIAYGYGVFDTLGIDDLDFTVVNLKESLFNVVKLSKEDAAKKEEAAKVEAED